MIPSARIRDDHALTVYQRGVVIDSQRAADADGMASSISKGSGD